MGLFVGSPFPQLNKNQYLGGGSGLQFAMLQGSPQQSQIANPAGLSLLRGSGFSHTRSGPAYCRKSTTFDVSNLAPMPENIAGWSQDNTGVSPPTVTGNYDVAPDGTKSATRIQFNAVPSVGNDSQLFVSPTVSAGTYTFSCYIKATDGVSTGTTYIMIQGVGLHAAANFTGAWQRFSVTAALGTGVTNIKIGADRTAGQQTPAMSACDIVVWGAKFELAASPTTYVSPMLVMLGSNIPRVEPEGLLLEGQATNLLLRSQDFANAAWTSNSVTPTASFGIAPDGTLTAQRANFTATLGNIHQSVAVAATSVTGSCWMRSNSGSLATAQLILKDASSGFTTLGTASPTLTTQWQLVTVSASITSGHLIDLNIQNTAAADIQIWGAQLETGTLASSYIPTTTASVARFYDVWSANLAAAMGDNGKIVVTITPRFSGAPGLGADFLSFNGPMAALYEPGDNGVASFVGASYLKPGPVFASGVAQTYTLSWTKTGKTMTASPAGNSGSDTFASSGTAGKTGITGGSVTGTVRDPFWMTNLLIYNHP